MTKIKQSIAVQRQIPEHIRLNYPLFVEFLKSYYDFLQQTQAQELEKIRDVDTSLDEFIDRFTSEVSTGIPLNRAQDKRSLIKHLREFYLSRGSEASYKFLFKTLFDKEAELFYPSQQILRVSDGKWRQDVSIFVKVTEGVSTLLPLNGNFITLTTSRQVNGKTITKNFTTYVERVVQYAIGVFELYIQRDYINEIDVGTRVTFTDNEGINYSANVLPCPAKLSVYKSGKGFNVGDIFALRTDIGNGCIIKITKVGSLGEVKNIQLISVGLDYLTTFYSYLSSKSVEGIEFVHPAKINTPFDAAASKYNERSGGFVDYGFANKQTYFDYDTSIPVGNNSFASDRFFADSSYVGDIETQFYAEDLEKPIDEDLAIIQVDLGAVAKYPGYYESQDGFISDEMYIQDGNYYQAYSYVIKVEEELRKYADVVKKILHPAGMKLFSEFSITNVLNVSEVKEALKNIIERISNVNAIDQGLGYTKYDLVNATPGSIAYAPDLDSPVVFSGIGKLSYYAVKQIRDSFTVPDKQGKSFVKGTIALTVGQSDSNVKHVFKALSHAIGLSDRGFNYDSYITSLINGQIVVTPDPNAQLVFAAAGKTAQYVAKRLADTFTNISQQQKSFVRPRQDEFNVFDIISKTVNKRLDDVISDFTDSQVKSVNKSINDFFSLPDQQNKDFSKALADVFTTVSIRYFLVEKDLRDQLSVLDNKSLSVLKRHSDQISIIDSNFELFVEKLTQSFVSLIDSSIKSVQKNISDSIIANSALFKSYSSNKSDNITIEDTVQFARELFFSEMVVIADTLQKSYSKALSDNISVSADRQSKTVNASKQDEINIESAGAIYIDPYDAELYFAPEDQYQANTPIT